MNLTLGSLFSGIGGLDLGRLKALGNAVVPQVGYVVGCVVAEVLRGGVA